MLVNRKRGKVSLGTGENESKIAKINMAKSGLPKSARKFLRKEKARIRRGFSNTEEAEAEIKELVIGIMGKYNKKKVETVS